MKCCFQGNQSQKTDLAGRGHWTVSKAALPADTQSNPPGRQAGNQSGLAGSQTFLAGRPAWHAVRSTWQAVSSTWQAVRLAGQAMRPVWEADRPAWQEGSLRRPAVTQGFHSLSRKSCRVARPRPPSPHLAHATGITQHSN